MRKTLLFLAALLILSASVSAQTGFITERDKRARRQEIRRLAQKLLDEPDTHKRYETRKKMVEKDVFLDNQDRPVEYGFAVPAFKWLYAQGTDDLNARLHAVIGLSELNAKAQKANDPLIAALRDKNLAIQLRALQALNQRGVKSAGPAVVAMLSSANVEVVTAAAQCLANIGYGGDGESTGPMIVLMARTYDQLSKAADDDPQRVEYQRTVEVLGRACGRLIAALNWAPGQSMKDLEKEVAKFTAWWNAKHVDKLKNRDHAVRKKALDAMRVTADTSIFGPLLDAVKANLAVMKSAAPLSEKNSAQAFVVEAGVLLSSVSGLSTRLQPTSQIAEIEAAVKLWDDWRQQHVR